MTQINLPFKHGHIIEARSFESGYRGAWFRCKILNIVKEKKELYYNLKYLDYPDEGMHKTKVFQTPPIGTKKWLMVRPAYPPVYHSSEGDKIKRDLEPLLVVHDSWKVGDLVDWNYDDCYWSGKILEVQTNEALQIELFPPPIGEGCIYKALSKDVRPSLEWSLEDGWKLPAMDQQKGQCAKLIKQKNEDQVATTHVCQTVHKQTERSTQKTVNKQTERATQKTMNRQTERATQQLTGDGELRLNIMESDDIEAAIYDLEELVVRIEWLKGMLHPNGGNSYWKYEDYIPNVNP